MAAATTSANQQLAKMGETAAAHSIERLGWTVLHQNWRSGKFGELDIVARDADGCLVFIEVKARRVNFDSESIGFSAVQGLKQHKVVTAAMRYLARYGLTENGEVCRFDVIVVNYPVSSIQASAQVEPEILHVRDAFHGFGWS